MFSIDSHGSTDNAERWLEGLLKFDIRGILEPYAKEGVRALASATPMDTGLAANSWTYEFKGDRTSGSIIWKNTNVESGFNVAIAVQYGYATGTGGYVAGRDYINPAIRPIFDRMSQAIWKEVKSL